MKGQRTGGEGEWQTERGMEVIDILDALRQFRESALIGDVAKTFLAELAA